MTRAFALALAAGLILPVASPAFASDVLKATKSVSGTRVSFAMPAGYFNATLSVAGPDGRVLQTFSKTGAASVDIGGQNAMGDGVYTYQITAASPQKKMIKAEQANGREQAKANMRGEVAVNIGAASSGTFVVMGGRIIDTSNVKETAQ